MAKSVPGSMLALCCGAALLLAGCSSSEKNEAGSGENHVDISKLASLKDHLDDGMKTIDQNTGQMSQEDIDQRLDTFEFSRGAEVYPQECTDITVSGDPLPIGTDVSSYSVLYGDTMATIAVVELPEDSPVDIDRSVKCAQTVVLGDGFSISANKNETRDQQVTFNAGRSLAITGFSEEEDGTSELTYGYRGWWDDRHFIKMDVQLFSVETGKANAAPDVYPSLSLWSTAVRLVQGEKL